MVQVTNFRFEPARHTVLRWLTSPAQRIPRQIHALLLGGLYNSPKAVAVATLSGVLENSFALARSGYWIFAVLLVVEITMTSVRFWISRKVVRASSEGLPIPTDLYLWATLIWCIIQGVSIFTCILTKIPQVQILAGATAAAFMGPICARNYAAPRWAILLSCIVYLPFVAGGLVLNESWSLILVFQAPIYFVGCLIVVEQLTKFATATHMAQVESHHNSVHDNLTRLVNRAGLREALLQPSWRGQSHFSVFYLDLDSFKAINDGFGHLEGDRLLQQVGTRLIAATRPDDIVARMGGDEFVVVAPGMAPEVSELFAASLIRRIVDPAIVTGDGIANFRFGVSVGYACAPYDGIGIEELIRKADTALIETKRLNKGTYRRFSDSVSKAPLTTAPIFSAA